MPDPAQPRYVQVDWSKRIHIQAPDELLRSPRSGPVTWCGTWLVSVNAGELVAEPSVDDVCKRCLGALSRGRIIGRKMASSN